jgi:hypothetical protein
MSARFVAGCARFVFLLAVIVYMSESRGLAQSQSGGGSGLDGGGATETITQGKRNLQSVAIDVPVQPVPRPNRDVSAEILDRDTEAKLALVVGDYFHFDETPFADVMSQIRNNTNVNILLHASAAGDLQPDSPISIDLRGVSLEKSLELLLVDHNCDFIIDHGIIRIISLDVASDPEFFMLRIYDCSELIQAVPSLMDRPTPPKNTISGGVPGEANASADPTIPTSTNQSHPAVIVPTTRLAKLVVDTVTPNEWSLTGSGDGVINQVGTCLVISHSRLGHRAVQDLISRMESKLIPK